MGTLMQGRSTTDISDQTGRGRVEEIKSINGAISISVIGEYETVAASQTAQVLGPTGAVGDLLHSIIITSSTGTITILDGAISVAVIPAGAVGVWLFDVVSVSGAWNITTGVGSTCTAVGQFT